MVAAPILHVSLDERGVAYVAGTSMKVADLAIDAFTWKLTPEQIQDNYPKLSLGQIYAALAYYHDHREEIDTMLDEWDKEYEAARTMRPNSVTREQLEARLRINNRPNAPK